VTGIINNPLLFPAFVAICFVHETKRRGRVPPTGIKSSKDEFLFMECRFEKSFENSDNLFSLDF